jgi:hypothetical protein
MREPIKIISTVIVTNDSVKERNPFGTIATLILVYSAYTTLLVLVAKNLF